jgi:hypothetical protein
MVGIAKLRLALLDGEAPDSQPRFDGAQVPQVKSLQFVAGDPDDRVRPAGLLAASDEGALHLSAILSILIAQHNESGLPVQISPQFLFELSVQVLLPLKNDEPGLNGTP